MTAITGVAILLAAFGACCYAAGAWLQHGAVGEVSGENKLGAAGLLHLLRTPRWLLGLTVIVGGVVSHLLALGFAPLTIVQPVGALALPLTVLLYARSSRGRLGHRATAGMVATVAGLLLFVLVAANGATSTVVGADAETRATQLVGLGLGVLCLVSLLAKGNVRCVALATGAGIGYGYVSLQMRSIMQGFGTEGITGIPLLSVLFLVLSLVVGVIMLQLAYSSGPPDLVVACLTVVDPLVAVGLGIGVLGEGVRNNVWIITGEVVGALAACVGVAILARYHPERLRRLEHKDEPTGSSSLATAALLGLTERKLRILIAADTFPPDINGAARFGSRLARGMVERGHEVHVVCPSRTIHDEVTDYHGVTVHRIGSYPTTWFHPTFRLTPVWRIHPATARLLDTVKPDVVHIQSHFLFGSALLSQGPKRGIPVVATNHFMPENLYGSLHLPHFVRGMAGRHLWRSVIRRYIRAQVVTAPTARAVELLHDNGFPAIAIPVSCGIDVDVYKRHADEFKAAHPEPRPPMVTFVGRLDEEKRIDELIRALGRIELPEPPHLTVVGSGACRQPLQALAAELGLADRVHFTGLVTDEEVRDAYAAADVFCMPSIAELQSIATMEAMSSGKPVVAADAMALPHLVRPGENGWLFEPGDVDGLARRLQELLGDPLLRATFGAASSRIIASHDIATVLSTFEDIYRAVIDGSPADLVEQLIAGSGVSRAALQPAARISLRSQLARLSGRAR
ncbi:glycosyltransferase family 4 protein [Fodinicola feengrottensis]|uniref:Glycosyltransferase family 4 protein n=1 Tax=Fodinicola feengrottensis TaxID=435914 RepID=A0ABN2J263_9ACTN